MTIQIRPDIRLQPAMEALAGRDADFARAYAACGLPPVRRNPRGFRGLAGIIVSQQVSTASARAILGRLSERMPTWSPGAFLALTEADHRAIGLSRPKSRYAIALAEDLVSRRLSLARLLQMEDEEAIAHLTQLKGFGRWSAEIYLLFSLGRPDVMPAADLALQVAAQRLKGLAERPTAQALYAMSEAWRPHRSAAARFLWHFYRHAGIAGV